MIHGEKKCINHRKEVQGGERLKEGSVAQRAGFGLLQGLENIRSLVMDDVSDRWVRREMRLGTLELQLV